jgi:hypothetical protein
VYLPALEEAGSIAISTFPNVTKIDLPQLKKAAGLSCSSMAKLSLIYAPLLEEATGLAYLYNLNALQEFELPALKQIGEINIMNCSRLYTLGFPKLTDVTTAISFQSLPVTSLDGFSSLQNAGTVTLYGLSLEKVKLSASVQRIDYLSVTTTAINPVLSEINVKGIHIGTLSLSGNALLAEKVIGDEVFSGTLIITMSGANPYPQLEGFSEVDSLSIVPQDAQEVHVRGIRKVRKGAYMRSNYYAYPRVFSIPDLEEVGGDFGVFFPMMNNSPETFTVITLDKLTRVGGNFTFEVNTKSVDTLRFPELTTVGGDFTLHSSYYNSGYYKGFETVSFPKLSAVGGKLTLTNNSRNEQLVNLNGFAKLASVGSIEITRQAALTDFSGLQELFKTLPEESWITPTNNSYNPTYQDLKEGKWTKPN